MKLVSLSFALPSAHDLKCSKLTYQKLLNKHAFALYLAGLLTLCVPRPSSALPLADYLELVAHNNATVQIASEQIAIGIASLRQAQGAFDTTLSASSGVGVSYTPVSTSITSEADQNDESLREISTSYALGLSKPLETGQTLGLTLEMERTDEDPASTEVANRGSLELTINQPILRGSDSKAVRTELDVGSLEVERKQATLRHTLASELSSAVDAYWSYSAVNQREQTLQDDVDRSINRLKDIRKLVAADEQPANEIDKAQAQVTRRKASLVQVQMDLASYRQQMASLAGVEVSRLDSSKISTEEFPMPSDSLAQQLTTLRNSLSASTEPDSLIWKDILARRGDLVGAELQVAQSERQLYSAQHDLLPELSLTLAGGYNSLSEGSAQYRLAKGLGENIPGANLSATLTYEFPFANNSRRGLRDALASKLRIDKISLNNLKLQVRTEVSTALTLVAVAHDSWLKSLQAVKELKLTLDQELSRYRLGVATLLDIEQVESELTQSQLLVITSQLNYSKAINQLWQALGGPLAQDHSSLVFDPSCYTRLPEPLGLKGTSYHD